MRLDVRGRLTLWYVAVLAGALALFTGIATWSVATSLRRALDERLFESYEVVEHRLRDGAGAPEQAVALPESDEAEGTPFLIEIAPEGGGGAFRSPALSSSGLGAGLAAVEDGRALSARSFTMPDGTRARGVARREEADGRAWLVRVALSEEPMRRQLSDLLWTFALALPVAALFAGAGGWWLAGRSLAPVERAIAELRRFTADASHELRTPLTALRAVGEVGLRESRAPAEYREVLGSMLEESDRLARLVDSLLALSRAEADELRLADRVDLGVVAREVADHLQVLAEEKRQSLTVDASVPAPVAADRDVLRRAVINLVDNAIKFAPDEGRVSLTTSARDGAVALEVSDDGPGIPPEHVSRVFDRFYRVDPARARETGGAGLGLAIARSIVERHGGRIELETQPGRGATFRVVLPRADHFKETP